MQASRAWSPPTGTLGAIVQEARVRAQMLRAREVELERIAEWTGTGVSLKFALQQPDVAVVAEIKRRSPSKGWINSEMEPVERARAYERGGATAISVLTEPEHFGGSAADLTTVQAAVGIPVLKKDFHVEPIQLLEARGLGASAALLIARALAPGELRRMMEFAEEIRLEVLVEVRDEDELERALSYGASLIGINNRNLETLVIDPTTSERLLAHIPPHHVAIAESGITRRVDVECAASYGADAVLVGSALSASHDPEGAVRALAGVRRTRSVRAG